MKLKKYFHSNIYAGKLITIFAFLSLSHQIFGQGNVGINNPSPSEKLDIIGNIKTTGEIKPNGTSGTSNQVLTSNGDGTMKWAGTPGQWINSGDTMFLTDKKNVLINNISPVVPTQANLEVTGNFLVQQALKKSNNEPTAGQVYTMNNNSGLQIIPPTDSVFRVLDPGGTAAYLNNVQGNIWSDGSTSTLGYQISFSSSDFGIGLGDTLWISDQSYPQCKSDFFNRYFNTTTPPEEIFIGTNEIYLIFRSNGNNNNGPGFDIKLRKIYSNNLTSIPIVAFGTALYFDKQRSAFRAGKIGSGTVGISSAALGNNTIASGGSSTASGDNTIASGQYSTAFGYFTKATDSGTTAMGNQTNAKGIYSTALGNTTIASGEISTALGNYTIASGDVSTAMGSNSLAQSSYSTSVGFGSITTGYASTVIGMFNDTSNLIIQTTPTSSTPLFVVGNGDAPNNRSNAMVVLKNGNIGIGTSTPEAPLNIVKTQAVNGPVHASSIAILESNSTGYLQFSGDNNDEFGILCGNNLTANRTSLIFRPDSSMWFRAGGNNTRMIIANNGEVGIGTTTPEAKLDVSGTTILGTNGSVLTEVIKSTVVNDLPSVPANSTITETFTVTNAVTGSTVFISPSSALSDGLIIAYARVSAANTVEVKFTNISASAINPGNMNYFITVIR